MVGSKTGQAIGDIIATLSSSLDREVLDCPSVCPMRGTPLWNLASKEAPRASYVSYNQEFFACLRDWQQRSSEDMHLALRSLLVQRIAARLNTLRDESCSDYVRLFTLRNFGRILAGIDKQSLSYYDIANDPYRKDLALVSARMFPIGSFLVERGTGIPRSLLYRNNARQIIRFLRFWLLARALTGYYQAHLNLGDLAFFNECGSRDFYYVCAEEIRLDSNVNGIVRSSWFMDPAMEEVGRNLLHHSKIAMENGAARFKYQDDISGESGALSFSPVRRKLFEEGRYIPAYYLLAWPRRQMLDWLSRQDDAPNITPELATWPGGAV